LLTCVAVAARVACWAVTVVAVSIDDTGATVETRVVGAGV